MFLLDLKLGQESGLEVLEEISRISPQAAVVMVTAYSSIETAVEAMRRGAFDYLAAKPCTPDQVRHVLAGSDRTNEETPTTRRGTRGHDSAPTARSGDLTSQSPAMQKILEIAFKAADSEATITLLLGESGTGG